MRWEYLSGAMSDFVDGNKGCVFVSAIINEEHRVTLNELGNDGWELVAIVSYIAYFKRPKKQVATNKDLEEIKRGIGVE